MLVCQNRHHHHRHHRHRQHHQHESYLSLSLPIILSGELN
jgi:hypothetical protein